MSIKQSISRTNTEFLYPLWFQHIIVYYVPRQSSRCLYENAEFNVWAEDEDDKTPSEYKQLNCLGTTYDTSHVGIDHRPGIGQMANLTGRFLAIVSGPDIKMWRAADAGYLTMGHLWNSSLNWWQIDHGPVENLRPAEYWPIVLIVGQTTLAFSAEPGLGPHWFVTITNTFGRDCPSTNH